MKQQIGGTEWKMRKAKIGLLLETEKMSSCGTAAMRGRQLPKHTVGRERVCSSLIGKHTRPRDLRARCLNRKGTVHGTTAGLGSSIKACYKSLRLCDISLRHRLHRNLRAPVFKEQPARGVLANVKKWKHALWFKVCVWFRDRGSSQAQRHLPQPA